VYLTMAELLPCILATNYKAANVVHGARES
jgi:hypothetical protein